MATRTLVDHPQPDWQRVAALSTSFLAHVVAAMAIALPIAWQARAPDAIPIVASVIEEPQPLPPPPAEPVPPTRPHTFTRTTPPPVAPPVPERSTVQVPAPPLPADTVSAPVESPVAPVNPGAGAAGPSRELAYDGALKLRYPPLALRQRQQGRVLLNVLVDAEGRVQRIEIARSSGHTELDAAARDAVQRARFRPVLRDGVAEPAWGVVPIEFRLDRA